MVTSVCAWLDLRLRCCRGPLAGSFLVRLVVRSVWQPGVTSGWEACQHRFGLREKARRKVVRAGLALSRMHYRRRAIPRAGPREKMILRTNARCKPRRPLAWWRRALASAKLHGGMRAATVGGPPDARSGCWPNGTHPPVLKHGPRSLTYMRVFGCFKP